MSHETMPGDEEIYLVARKKIRCISVCEHVTRRQGPVTDFDAARALLKPFFDQEPYEVVYAVALDSSNRFLGFMKLEEGTSNSARVHLRKIFTFLLCETNATGLILAHNHPGGSTQPSREDIALTRKIHDHLKELDVRLLDHIIYAPGLSDSESSWVSLQNMGLVPA